MAKRNLVSRRQRMVASLMKKMKDHNIYLISDRFIGEYGHLTNRMNSKELRYAAGVLSSVPVFEDITVNMTQWQNYCSKVHHVNGVTVILDKGSRKITHNMFVNPRGSVFMVEENGKTHYFNKHMSKFILKNVVWLDQCYTVEEVQQCEGWDTLFRKVTPHIHKGDITIKAWYWDGDDNDYYSEAHTCSFDNFMDVVSNMVNDNSVEFLTLHKADGEYLCAVEYVTGVNVPNYPYVVD